MNFMATLSFTRGCNSSPLKNKWLEDDPFLLGFRRNFQKNMCEFH